MHNKKLRKADFCVIGAGPAGLSFAQKAIQSGASVILIERGEMGGNSLNYGSIPSKAFIAASKIGSEIQRASKFGWKVGSSKVDFEAVQTHVRQIISSLEPRASLDHFERMGVKVIEGEGAFVDQETLETRNHIIKAKRFIIATGCSPYIPPIQGLSDVIYYTNQTIFDLTELPDHLAIIGGGRVGVELAQVFHRFGSTVTLLEAHKVLSKYDSEMTNALVQGLTKDGISIIENVDVQQVKNRKKLMQIDYLDNQGHVNKLEASHLLIATGRYPTLGSLNLQGAGIESSEEGIKVNAHLRTTNRRVYAVGDCIGDYQHTHAASYQADLALKNSLFRLPSRLKRSQIPWVTYTDPELAQIGALEVTLRKNKIPYKVLKHSYQDNDRAHTDCRLEGQIKVLVSPRGQILGATIIGNCAGELIFPWAMAIQNKMKISAIANTIAPYPTFSEVSKRAAGSFYEGKLVSFKVPRIVKFIMGLTK